MFAKVFVCQCKRQDDLSVAGKLYRLTFWSRRDPRVRCPMEKVSKSHTSGENDCHNRENTEPSEGSSLPSCQTSTFTFSVVDGDIKTTGNLEMTEKAQAAAAANFLHEPPFWKRVVNVTAVICVTLSTIVYGYYW